MSRICLTYAGLLTFACPSDQKTAEAKTQPMIGLIFARAFMLGSRFLLWLTKRDLPLRTSYADEMGSAASAACFPGVGQIFARVIPLNLRTRVRGERSSHHVHRVSLGHVPGLFP
jgi:hypothetical protein